MNIIFDSNKPVHVRVFLTFPDNLVYEFRVDLNGRGSANYCVIGRTPQDVVKIEMEYDGVRYGHPVIPDGKDLAPINIYGGRDRWTQLLREAAMKAEADERSPPT
jgi:hypothetical protein